MNRNSWLICGFVTVLVLAFVVPKVAKRVEERVTNHFTKVIQSTIDKSVTERFKGIKNDIDKSLHDADVSRKNDQQRIDAATGALSDVTSNWVQFTCPDPDTSKATDSNGAEHKRLTREIRAQLSREFEGKLKREANRADQCAVDYNDLNKRYQALSDQVEEYNKWASEHNSTYAR